MRNNKHVFIGLITVFFIVFLGLNIALSSWLWPATKHKIYEENSIVGLIPKGEKIKPSLLGFETFFSDLYWIRVVQYIGGNALAEKKSLYPFIDLITDLSPGFYKPYQYGFLMLPNDGQMENTKKLIEKGEENLPDYGPVYYNAAYFYFFYLEDADKAIEYYKKCLQVKECLPAAERMIITLEARQGRYEVSIEQWIYQLQRYLSSGDMGNAELAKKKIEESFELLLLTQAMDDIYASGKEIPDDISGLVGYSFPFPKEKQKTLQAVLAINEVLGLDIQLENNGNIVILSENIVAPFPTNPYQVEEGKVRTKLF